MHGLRPGPYLFEEQPALLYAIFAAMLLANVTFLALGLVGAKGFSRVSLIPRQFLWPSVFVLCLIGAYGLRHSMADVWIMMVAGVAGVFLRRHGFSPAPIVMGLVLGTLLENSFAQSMIIFDHAATGFLQRPIALLFFALALCGLFFTPAVRLARALLSASNTGKRP